MIAAGAIFAAENVDPTIELSIKDIITTASIVLTVVMLGFSLWKGLRQSRMRPMFDVVRIIVQVSAAVAVPIITGVVTPPMLMFGAALVGLAVGVLQGMFVDVEIKDDHIFASRSTAGFLIWGAGLVMMQGAGMANRTGLVEIGQAVTWLSIGISVGLVLGRHTNVDRALKAVQAAAPAALLVLAAVATISGTDVPVAEAQGCPPGYEQGYYDEDTESQVSTSDPKQCSKWVNGRQGTYSVYRQGCNLNDEWVDLSGQSPTDRIYGRHQGLGFVLYANMIVRIATFPRSNDFDLEPAAEVYAQWFGPSCASAPEPPRPAPTSAPSNSGQSTSRGTSTNSGGNSSGGNSSGGNSSSGGGTSGGESSGNGQTTAPGNSPPAAAPAPTQPPPTPRIVTEQLDPNEVPQSAPIEDEGGSLFPTAVPETPSTVPAPTTPATSDQPTDTNEAPTAVPTAVAGNANQTEVADGLGSTVAPTPGPGTADGADDDGSTGAPVPDSEEVTEDEALATAVGGLVAAAAAGVITAAEAAAGIREALDRSGRSHVDENELLQDVLDEAGVQLPSDGDGATTTGDKTDGGMSGSGDDPPNGSDISRAQAIARDRETDIDQDWRRAREKGQALVDELETLRRQLDGATDAERAQLMERARQLAIDINADYSARSIMKPQGKSPLAEFFDQTLLAPVYRDVDGKTIDRLNDLGLTRGGQPFKPEDMWDVRNEASAGTVGMDRDLALREAKAAQQAHLAEMERAQNTLNTASPDSSEYAAARDALAQHRDAYQRSLAETTMSIDPDRLRAGALAEIDSLPAGSKRRAELEDLVRLADRLGGKRTPGGGAEVRLSPTDWNQITQTVYDGEYERVTGQSSRGSYQAVTTGANPEAYADTNALRSDRQQNPLAPEHASQTASVGGVKDAHNRGLADDGLITRGEAMQETARGTAKDMGTKVIPQLRLDPNVSPARIEEFERIRDVFERAGRGEISPSQIDAALVRATGDRNITMDNVLQRVESNFESSIARGNTDSTRSVTATTGERLRSGATEVGNRLRTATAGDALGVAGDAATVNQRMQENMANGMSGAEAATVAVGQTAAGNTATEALRQSGLADPRTLMTGGALLPRPMQDILPDQMAENTIGTGYGLGNAALQSLSDSIDSHTLDTTAFDAFATDLASGNQHTDPLTAVATLADFAGEESSRTDGGSVVSDLQQIYDTGVGGDMVTEFQQGVADGDHGAVLQGVDHASRAASDFIADPTTTASEFLGDLATIAEHGVGDGYWGEAAQHTENVARDVPLLGSVITGYEEIAEGMGESGVGGFTTEMAEGATALGSEISESLGQSASDAAEYLRSFF